MKRVLIIGATSAIAAACARIWAEQHAEFFLVSRNKEKLEQMSADLIARGATVTTYYCMDVADLSSHAEMLEQCFATLKQIDIAMIAHGTLPNQQLCEQDVEMALRELTINGTSVISLLTLLAKQFETQHYGTLAVISSVAGDRGRPSNYLYGTAKAAVSTFCEGLRARLYKAGVHVVDIKPGFVDTPMTQGLTLPAALIAKPEQVAKRIIKGIEKKTAILYVPGFWKAIMLTIKLIPHFVFKRTNL